MQLSELNPPSDITAVDLRSLISALTREQEAELLINGDELILSGATGQLYL